MASNTIFIVQIIHCCFQQWKNFQTRLTADEVIAKSSTLRFLKHSVYRDALAEVISHGRLFGIQENLEENERNSNNITNQQSW